MNNTTKRNRKKATTPQRRQYRSRRDSAVGAAQQLEKLVQTVQRQFVLKSSDNTTLQIQHPVPIHAAAAAALGRQVGTTLVTFLSVCLDEEKLHQVRDDLLLRHVFCVPTLHPSFAHSILETVLEAYSNHTNTNNNTSSSFAAQESLSLSSFDFEVLDWLPNWILQVEKCLIVQSSSSSSSNSLMETLSATMRAYALALQVHVLNQVQEENDYHLEQQQQHHNDDNDDNQKQNHEPDDNDDNDDDDDNAAVLSSTRLLLDLHGRLQLVSSRMALVRHIIPLLVTATMPTTPLSLSTTPLFHFIVPILAPLLTSSVLHLGRELHEKWAALQLLWRATERVLSSSSCQQQQQQNGQYYEYYALDLMQFMTNLLDWFLWGLANTTTTNNNTMDQQSLLHQSLEIAQTFWTQLTGTMAPALLYNIQSRLLQQQQQQQHDVNDDDDSSIYLVLLYGRFQEWIRRLLRDTLPRLVKSVVAVPRRSACCCPFILSVQSLLQQQGGGCNDDDSSFSLLLEDMCDLSSAITTSRCTGNNSTVINNNILVLLDDPVLVFHWASLILTSPRGEDRRALLETIVPLLKQQQQQNSGSSNNKTNNNRKNQQLLHAVALINLHDETCREAAAKVIWLLQQQEPKESLQLLEPTTRMAMSHCGFHIMQQVLQQQRPQHIDGDDDKGSSLSSSSPLIGMAAKYSLPLLVPVADGGGGGGTMVLDDGCCYFSPAQQAGALLFGIALLQQQQDDEDGDNKDEEKSNYMNDGYNFLQRLLVRYPHLGISLLPIFIDRLNHAGRIGNGRGVIRELEFLCRHLVSDPHCAQEVWNLVGHELVVVKTGVVPLQMRVLLIRLFPQLLRANKRLYRRVIETLSHIMSTASSVQIDRDKEQEQAEIRLAVAGTIADLAKDDDVRDVSDVIAIIQRLLTQDAMSSSSSTVGGTITTTSSSNKTIDTPEQPAIMLDSNPMQTLQVHYAILSLHYLVVAQELDFEVVLKVLNKRLCPVTNVEQILQLPPVVLEALVLLLGDGECNDDDDSSSNDGGDKGGAKKKKAGISPQVSRAVETLLQLASAMVDRIITQCNENGDNRTNFRVLSNILKSLGNYSMNALGLDEELIKEVAGKSPETVAQGGIKSDNRYVMLHQLIVDALEELPNNVEKDDQTQDSLLVLLRNLLKFEQETLGSSLWEKRGKRQLKPGDPGVIPRGRLSALPSPSSVREHSQKGNQNSPSIACAMLFASECEGFELLSHFRDESDACIESTDPAFLVFAVQAYLTTAARVVGTVTEQEIGQVLIDVGAWCKVYTTRDAMYLALAAMSLYIPHTLRESESSEHTYAQEIRGVITSAYKNQRFQKDDVSKICLGLVGVASLRESLVDAVQDIVSLLEQSVRGYCGQQSFGAYYGLGLIGQILPKCLGSSSTSSSSSSTATSARNHWDERIFSILSRISGFLVEELLSCFEHGGPSCRNLVVCFKSGIVTSDLISSIRQNQPGSIPLLTTKQVAAKYLCISCALCLPSLCAINGQLLLATLHLFEAFSWGCGKGVAVPSIIRACQAAGLLRQGEMESIHTDYASLFETLLQDEFHESGGNTLEDLFIAVVGTSDNPAPQLARSVLFGDDVCLNDDGCALTLLASASTICTFPCFGGDLFPLPARLKPSTQADIKSIVDIVSNALDMADESKYSDMGIVLLGLLSSLRNHTAAIAVDHCLPKTNKQQSTELSGLHGATSQVDFSTLPYPKSQTILSVITDAIERSVGHGASAGIQSPSFTRLLEALEVVVLPDQFSAGFLEPVIHQLPDESNKPALVNLLVSQVRGRRPATMGGTGFVQLSLQISLATDADWKSTLGDKAVNSFVKYMEHFLPKYPIDTLKEVVANIWHHSFAAGKPLITTFLAASERLLEGDRLTENGKDIYGTILVGQIMSDLQTFPFHAVMDRDGGVLLEQFARCLNYLPLYLLESEGFFKYDESEPAMDDEVLRVACSTELIRLGFFKAVKSEVHQRSRISAWISRRLVVALDDESVGVLRRLIFCLVEAVNKERPYANKPNQLAELLEILLLSRGSRIGLEWLAITMSIWCGGQGSDADLSLGCLFTSDLRSMHGLSDLCQIMLHDLPFNVGTLCRKEKVSAIVFNLLHRLFLRWSEDDECAVEPETLDCLRRTLISCRPGLAKEDVFVSVACDALSSASLNSEGAPWS